MGERHQETCQGINEFFVEFFSEFYDEQLLQDSN